MVLVVVAGGEREDLRSEKVGEEEVEEVDDVEEDRERISVSGENIVAGVCIEDTRRFGAHYGEWRARYAVGFACQLPPFLIDSMDNSRCVSVVRLCL